MKNDKNIISSIEYPPGPSSILPNKLLRQFIRNPIKTLMDIAYTYDDIAHFKVGRRRHVYLLNNPDYIEDVLIRNHKNFITAHYAAPKIRYAYEVRT